MSARVIDDEKHDDTMIELGPDGHDALAGGGKDAQDIVAAASMAPIGGLKMTPEEYKLVRCLLVPVPRRLRSRNSIAESI